jgi:hypothetical protein
MKTAACTLLSVRVELVQAHLRMIRVCSKWAWTSSARTVVVDAWGVDRRNIHAPFGAISSGKAHEY